MLWLRLACLFVFVDVAAAHGRLVDPAGRNSMWRYGFQNPPNYDDTALSCGGRAHQWEQMGGKCGICGDPYDQWPRPHENRGKYARGVITGQYLQGETITIAVQVTANHGGYFEFSLCPLGRMMAEATESCLRRHLLELMDGSTRFVIPEPKVARIYTITVRLPKEMSCRRCVLQWKWTTGNSWGCDENEDCCTGCGQQEQFINCADIGIRGPVRTFVPNSTMKKKMSSLVPETAAKKKTVVYGSDGARVSSRDEGRPIVSRKPKIQPSAGYHSWRKPVTNEFEGRDLPMATRKNRYEIGTYPSGFRSVHSSSGSSSYTREEVRPQRKIVRSYPRVGTDYGYARGPRTEPYSSGSSWDSIRPSRSKTAPDVGRNSAGLTDITRDVLAGLAMTVTSRGGVAERMLVVPQTCLPKYDTFSVDCKMNCVPNGGQMCNARKSLVGLDVACLLLCQPSM